MTKGFNRNPILGEILKFFNQGFDNLSFVHEFHNSSYTAKFKYPYLDPPDFSPLIEDYENSKILTKQALEWINDNNKNRFFLWLHYTIPHEPYNPSVEFTCRVDEICTEAEFQTLINDRASGLNYCHKSNELVPKKVINSAEKLYDAEILSSDEQVGKILDRIYQSDLGKNSIVVFYSDHGEGFDHNIFHHGDSLYDSNIKIPLIIKLPSTNKSKIINEPIDNADILPTLLELLGIESKNYQFEGASFASKIRAPFNFQSSNRKIYTITPTNRSNKYSVFDGTYKYIHSKGNVCLFDNSDEELYDLENDPKEEKNLITQEADLVEKMKSDIDIFFKRSGKLNKDTKDTNEESIIDKMKHLGY